MIQSNIARQIGESFGLGLSAGLSKIFEPQQSGENFGRFLSEAIQSAVEKLDFTKIFTTIVQELNRGSAASTNQLNLQAAAGNIGRELGRATYLAGNPATKAMGALAGNLARSVTWSMVPHLVAGIASLTGTPLLAYYLYRRAVYNIGRPKLATRERKVALVDRFQSKIFQIMSAGLEALRFGVKWGWIVGITSFGSFMPIALSALLFQNKLLLALVSRNRYFKGALALTCGSAFLASAYSAITQTYQSIKKRIKSSKLEPVFNQELASQIKDIAESTYNLRENKGKFQNLLLYGPAGTGKTMIAEKIAEDSRLNCFMMSGGDLPQYIQRGEHVAELNKLFESMKKSSTPTILFIDEVEAFCLERNGKTEPARLELLSTFLNQTGGLSDQFMLICATNKKELLDPAFVSRMTWKVRVDPPGMQERKEILKQNICTQNFTVSEQEVLFNNKTLDEMAQQTDGMTGRDLSNMINAMYGKKMCSANQTLTLEAVQTILQRCIKQHKDRETMGEKKDL